MKQIRIILIILVIVWMAVVFSFSNEPADESTNTSSGVITKLLNIIYGDSLQGDELTSKIEAWTPVVRKLAHFTLYTAGGFLICSVLSTYKTSTKKKILISQGIGSLYAISDELHQYFIPRKKLRSERCTYRFVRGIYWHNVAIAFD